MAEYDWKAGKKRIVDILDNKLEVIEKDTIPNDDEFTYSNAYLGWVTGIFVDIRDSSKIFTQENKELVSKMIRSFTSESIEILRKDENLREIGIRGDCVYGVYTTPSKEDIYNVLNGAFYLNTFMKMLNALLEERSYPQIEVGIGISAANELIVKAGRKDTGLHNKVWIGNAVSKASNLSSVGSKNGIRTIVLSSLAYSNTIDILVEKSEEEAKEWFSYNTDPVLGSYYDANIIKTDFNEWIKNGMQDE